MTDWKAEAFKCCTQRKSIELSELEPDQEEDFMWVPRPYGLPDKASFKKEEDRDAWDDGCMLYRDSQNTPALRGTGAYTDSSRWVRDQYD